MKRFLRRIKRSTKKMGITPFLLGAVALLLGSGAAYAPFAHTPPEIASYNKAIDGMYAFYFSQPLQSMQVLWHEAKNPVVREASAYNFGTFVGNVNSGPVQALALQALADAVRMNPDDERAKENLEIILRRIAKQKEQSDSNGSQEGNQNPKNGYSYNQIPSAF